MAGEGLVSGLGGVHFKLVLGNAQSHNAAPPPPQSHPTCSVALLDLSLGTPRNTILPAVTTITIMLQKHSSATAAKTSLAIAMHSAPADVSLLLGIQY